MKVNKENTKKLSVLKMLLILVLYLFIFNIYFTINAQETTFAIFYIDYTNGSDTNNGNIDKPFKTITKARDAVRKINSNMNADIIVYLRGGSYLIDKIIEFNETDSGTNGYNVIYKAYPGEEPVLSGGKKITGWTLYNAEKNIYKATLKEPVKTRHLYVNGNRAVRARSEGGLPGTLGNLLNGNKNLGFTTSDTSIAKWANTSDIEMVYAHGFVAQRCTVQAATVAGGETQIIMKQPAWQIQQARIGLTFPNYFENAFELLDEEGEFYLDNTGAVDSKNGPNTFYYKPKAGEDMSTAEAIAPFMEELVTLKGSSIDKPIHNIQFHGIKFNHTTYMRPGTNLGTDCNQANILTESPVAPSKVDRSLIPAAVNLTTAKSIVFERCGFSKLGTAALNMVYGSQDNLIRGCTFIDIGASGIQMGNIYEHNIEDNNPIDTREWLRNNKINNNYFDNLCIDFPAGVAIFGAHPVDTEISNNEICNMPYSGISIGWNWGTADSCERNTRIVDNYFHDVMLTMNDGGAIYHLGTSYDFYVSRNYIVNQIGEYGAIYLDNGTTWSLVEKNVCKNVPAVAFVNTGTEYNVYKNNYANVLGSVDSGKYNEIEQHAFIKDGKWPEEAKEVMENAGLTDEYKDILPDDYSEIEYDKEFAPEPLEVDFENKTAWVTGIRNTTKLRNDYASKMGCRFTVGSSQIKVTALGRVFTPNTMETHKIEIIKSDRETVVAAANIDMQAAPSNGAFKYVQLEAPVILEPNQEYYLVSTEGAGDKWFNSGLKIDTTSVASIYGAVFRNDLTGGGNGKDTFVGLDFLYEASDSGAPLPVTLPELQPLPLPNLPEGVITPVDLPVDTKNTKKFVTEIIPGNIRNDWSGFVGMKIKIGDTPIAVTALGRLAVGESRENHILKIYDATLGNQDLEISSTVVNMEGGQDKQFKYASLPIPVVLEAGREYYILSREEYGKDAWYDGNMRIIADSEIAAIKTCAYKTHLYKGSVGAPYVEGEYSTGNALGGLDFMYTKDLSVANRNNIIYNGDFEYSLSGHGPHSAKAYNERAITLKGSDGSARIDNNGANGSILQYVKLDVNKTYEFSIWAKMDRGTGTPLFRLVHPSGSNPGTTYIMPTDNKVTTEWKQFKGICKFTAANPRSEGSLEFNVVSPTDSVSGWSYYIDDFIIKEIPDTIAAGDFEFQPSNFSTTIPMWRASAATFTREIDNTVTLNKSRGSAKVEMTAADGRVLQPVRFEKGKTYELSAWVKLAGGKSTAQIVINHGGQPVYLPAAAVSVGTDWKQITASYTYDGDSPIGLADVYIRIGDGKKLFAYYFDDFVMSLKVDVLWSDDSQLNAKNITDTSLELSWPAANGDVTGYKILMNDLEYKTVTNDVLCLEISGLKDSREYDFTVMAIDSMGSCTYINNPKLSVRTIDKNPPKWLNYSTVKAVQTNSDTIKLYWSAAYDLSEIETYTIKMNGQEIKTVSGDFLDCEIKGFDSGKKYTFTVTATDKNGLSSTSHTSAVILTEN